MFNPNTPIHMIYTNMTCPCSQCQKERNAPTAMLPRLAKSASQDIMIAEIVTYIDSETGLRETYYRPIRHAS